MQRVGEGRGRGGAQAARKRRMEIMHRHSIDSHDSDAAKQSYACTLALDSSTPGASQPDHTACFAREVPLGVVRAARAPVAVRAPRARKLPLEGTLLLSFCCATGASARSLRPPTPPGWSQTRVLHYYAIWCERPRAFARSRSAARQRAEARASLHVTQTPCGLPAAACGAWRCPAAPTAPCGRRLTRTTLR